MPNDEANIPLHCLPQGILDFFVDRGVTRHRLLQATEIPAAWFKRSGNRISYRQLSQLVHNGIACLNEPGLGLAAGLEIPWCYYGTLGEVIQRGPSLAEVGTVFRRYLAITQPYYYNLYLYPDYYLGQDATFIHPIATVDLGDVSQAAQQFEFEFRLAVTARLFAECGDRAVRNFKLEARLHHRHQPLEQQLQALPCSSVRFSAQPDVLAAPHVFFTSSWRESRRGIFAEVVARLEVEYQNCEIDTSLKGLVRWHVMQSFTRQISLSDIAGRVGMSERTICRKLAAECTSFRSIVNEVKIGIVQQHLSGSRLSMSELAQLMDFSCEASLRRAIRNWQKGAA